MLKVAIVGCGKIADAHAAQIQRIEDCEIVAVCDREPLMARQFVDRFPVKHSFTDVTELLCTARPDVVHITTPPEGHFELAKLCLEHGANVYVEKPFTVYANEAEKLIHLADKKGLKLTAGHNYQFSPAARRMRELVKSGYLGSDVVHPRKLLWLQPWGSKLRACPAGRQAPLGSSTARGGYCRT